MHLSCTNSPEDEASLVAHLLTRSVYCQRHCRHSRPRYREPHLPRPLYPGTGHFPKILVDFHIDFCSKANNSVKADARSPRLTAWARRDMTLRTLLHHGSPDGQFLDKTELLSMT